VGIERMKKVAVLVPAENIDDFTSWLYGRSVLDLETISPELPEGYRSFGQNGAGLREKVAQLEEVLAFCERWTGPRKSFLENIFSAKRVASTGELERAAVAVDPQALHQDAAALQARRDALVERLNTVEKESERLIPFATVKFPPAELLNLAHVRLMLVRLGPRAEAEMVRSAPEELAWERLSGDLFWVAFPRDHEESASLLVSLGAHREAIPALEITFQERLAILADEKAGIRFEIEGVEQECREFAAMVDTVELALGYWQAQNNRDEDLDLIISSKRIGVAHGYLPAPQLQRFTQDVRTQFDGDVLAEDPRAEENVPVKLKNSRFFRPAGLLVNMFGVPDYFSIDPTPYLTFSFLAFFGICFGDVFYGIGLIAISLALMFRFRKVGGLRQFFLLFFYAGVSTTLFGALTGSWAADLPNYLGEGNLLLRLRDSIPHFDPLARPIMALVAVIFIGVINQYYGIILMMLRDKRKGNWKGAVYDGGLWLIYLTGFVMLIASIFVSVPSEYMWTAVALLSSGAVGLLLTQGRHEETLLGRVAVGVVSLYGILGSYGAFVFLGDALSYSRLLALGLTTFIVGMSFNILANIVAGIPGLGFALFIGMLLFGHTFNFTMSMISAFVHPARLILLEFFSRFYEVGGIRYEPFGFRSDRVEISD
jgi:V/A-type H+/Na+-transporting ATPase subunit I